MLLTFIANSVSLFFFSSRGKDICRTEGGRKVSHFSISFLYPKMKVAIIFYVTVSGLSLRIKSSDFCFFPAILCIAILC